MVGGVRVAHLARRVATEDAFPLAPALPRTEQESRVYASRGLWAEGEDRALTATHSDEAECGSLCPVER